MKISLTKADNWSLGWIYVYGKNCWVELFWGISGVKFKWSYDNHNELRSIFRNGIKRFFTVYLW